MRLSVIIPSYKDPLLVKTIESLLTTSQLGDQLEVIVVLDGYWPDFELPIHPQVRYVHLGKNGGMRDAINAGVAVSRGYFIMKTDEHCMFSSGFDKIMTDACQPNWIMTSLRHDLDVAKWENMPGEPTGNMKLVIHEETRFAGVRWRSRDRKLASQPIDETMSMQGSCWVMPRSWWDQVIVRLQNEGYGTFAQETHEMVFKTWQAGGKLMLNKATWYSHKHRSFGRTHRTPTSTGWKYALELWRPYYESVIRPRWGI